MIRRHGKLGRFEADIGIVIADYAVAYTGSITVLSSEDKGRSVSLLPTALIAIVPLERLKTRLGEVLIDFDEAGYRGFRRASILSPDLAVQRILRMI